MNKKKIFLVVLALVLVCSLSVAGTLAYLTASQDGENAVVNTFVAAGGGKIIKDANSFSLVESKATYVDTENVTSERPTAGYYLESEDVYTNEYNMAMPGMIIPKNPNLTVDLVESIDAYIFVKVTDSTNGNLGDITDDVFGGYTVTSDWTEITISGLTENEKVYLYKNDITTGAAGETVELSGVGILSDNNIVVKNVDGVSVNFVDTDTNKDGIQLGTLKFEAYACQATGFSSAADAFTACFVSTSRN